MVKEAEVSDPSDWADTSLPTLSPLDAALRCQVCKEFYDTPMITSCSHTFCSLCIRRCLSSDGKCPACRSEDQSSKLRRNWTVQECVDAFVTSRAHALQLAKRAGADGHQDDHPRRKRRRVAAEDVNGESERRTTRSSARCITDKAPQKVIALDSDHGGDDDDDYNPDMDTEPQNDGLVACPMCSRRMQEEAVFAHLDRCDGTPHQEREPARRSAGMPPARVGAKLPPPAHDRQPHSPTGTSAEAAAKPKHLPHLNYSLLKDAALKNKLKELGMPTWGSRQLLIRRHTQWVDIFNANSDSPRPKTKRDLLRDLDLWERTQGGHAQDQGQSGTGRGVMRKDFDGDEWTGKHKDQFEDLIAKARAKRSAATAPKDGDATQAPVEMERSPGAMEGIEHRSVSTDRQKTSLPAPSSAGQPPLKLPPTINTLNSSQSSTNQLSEDLAASPVASMLRSAAQDVRRRNSVSSASPTSAHVAGLISTHSIPSVSPTPAINSSQTPRRLGPPSLSDANGPATAVSQTPVDEDHTSLRVDTHGAKSINMFRVPESPINDVEGLGAANGG